MNLFSTFSSLLWVKVNWNWVTGCSRNIEQDPWQDSRMIKKKPDSATINFTAQSKTMYPDNGWVGKCSLTTYFQTRNVAEPDALLVACSCHRSYTQTFSKHTHLSGVTATINCTVISHKSACILSIVIMNLKKCLKYSQFWKWKFVLPRAYRFLKDYGHLPVSRNIICGIKYSLSIDVRM